MMQTLVFLFQRISLHSPPLLLGALRRTLGSLSERGNQIQPAAAGREAKKCHEVVKNSGPEVCVRVLPLCS